MSLLKDIYCNAESLQTNIIATIIGSILLISCILIYSKGAKISCNVSNLTPKSIKISYHLSCIFWFITLFNRICALILPMISSLCNNNSNDNVFRYIHIIIGSGGIFYWMGLITSYLLFVFRLKHAFMDTPQQLSSLTYTILLIIYPIQIIPAIFDMSMLIIPDLVSQKFELVYRSLSGFIFYITPSVILMVLYIKKSIKLARHSTTKDSYNVLRLQSAITYLNCVTIVMITHLIIVIIAAILREYVIKGKISLKIFFWIVRVMIFMDTCINIILLHLQFSFMNKCYKLLCNPFRLEINHIVNKHLNGIQLTVIDIDPTITNGSTISSDTSDVNTSTNISGLAPTHTSKEGKPGTLRPMSHRMSNSSNEYDIYLCQLCPIVC